MTASLAPWIFGASSALLYSSLFLAAPAMLAVRRLLRTRVATPLQRNDLERQGVLLAGVLGAIGALATADGIALALFSSNSAEAGTMLASFIAPAPLAAVPCVAGELLSGASLRPFRAFCAAAAAASAISWIVYAIVWAGGPRAALTPATAAIQLAGLFLSGHFAARAYLATRGPSCEPAPPEAIALQRML
jgi:hypothetical protein